MMKAAEDLKQQQLLKEQERQRILGERIIKLPDLENVTQVVQLKNLQLQNRITLFLALGGEFSIP